MRFDYVKFEQVLHMRVAIRESGDRTNLFVACMTCALLATNVCSSHAQQVTTRNISRQEVGGVRLDMIELFRVGSLDKPRDSFGRVMSVALDHRGRLFVADDQAVRVAVFDHQGRYLQDLGRKGKGPGELERPWLIAVDSQDSVYVWDPPLGRLNVFGPNLRYVRSLHLPVTWNVTSIDFLMSGDIAVAAMSGADETGAHIVRRNGSVVRSFVPIDRVQDLAGFESSLLGGSLDVVGSRLVYTRKSPYELLFFNNEKTVSRCLGQKEMTSRPLDVINVIPGQGAGLQWQKYIHSSSVILVDTGLVINVILDPTQDQRIVDLVNSQCQLIRRTRMKAPITFVDRAGDRMAAVSNVEFPEVIVYRVKVERR